MSTNTEQAKAVFLEAVEKYSPEDWTDFLTRACGDDQTLRQVVERLLRAHQAQDRLFDGPAPTVASATREQPGQMIGPYKLRECLGTGGMGVVWAAEQKSPLRRVVALKVIKPGMDSEQVLARFEAEREALALMNHPNIARVLDAGTTDEGRPYFVMELIRGLAMTDYCDVHKLTVHQRIALFIQVCKGAQHAHQKGVIHRDIKPSNVLVEEQDGTPVPKIIDFGVAKALHHQLTDRSIYTGIFQAIGTLAYMSPEQATLSPKDIDTRSDVYGLGTLLFELLTGSTPFERKVLERSALDEALRIIREQDAPKPSTKVSSLAADVVTVVSERRGTDKVGLDKMIRGDLDWIVMKSLEKDRTRRYDTANDLAADLQRFLHQEPVAARPPSAGYRMSRFVRRNRSAVVFSSLLAITVILATAALAIAFLDARRRIATLRSMVIERALLHAVAGEMEQLEATIAWASEIGVPSDWLRTLEGVSHIHRADNDLAVQRLSEAVAINPDNVSAIAMLSLACFHSGDWEQWSRLAADIRTLQARDEYREFDTLFLGYGWFYIDFQEAAFRLREVLEEHPSWYVPRSLLAGALAHDALSRDSADAAREALDEIQAPLQLAGENPVVLVNCLYVLTRCHEVLGDNDAHRQALAADIAVRLERGHRDYPIGSLIRAAYYESVGDTAKATSAWKDMLQHGHGTLILWPAATLAATGDIDPERDLQGTGSEPEVADVARACLGAMSGDEHRRQAAREVFERGKDRWNTWIMRHMLIQIPLLLGDVPVAREQCRAWLETASGEHGLEDGSWWDKESIEFLAGVSPTRPDPHAADLSERWFAHYQRGFLAYADGELDKAARHFAECISTKRPARAGWRRYWAVLMEQHIQTLQARRQQEHGKTE